MANIGVILGTMKAILCASRERGTGAGDPSYEESNSSRVLFGDGNRQFRGVKLPKASSNGGRLRMETRPTRQILGTHVGPTQGITGYFLGKSRLKSKTESAPAGEKFNQCDVLAYSISHRTKSPGWSVGRYPKSARKAPAKLASGPVMLTSEGR